MSKTSTPSQPQPEGLPVWVIYDHPSDYPDCYVARLWINDQPTANTIASTDLEKLRDAMEEMGLSKLLPLEGDQPHIIETWL